MSPGQPGRAGQFWRKAALSSAENLPTVIGELLPRRDSKLIIR